MPTYAVYGVIGGVIFGVICALLANKKPDAKWVPSGLAFGIAMIIPAFYSMAMFIGTVIFVVWAKRNPKDSNDLAFAIASGLIAGEGLMGVVSSVMTLLGIGGGGGH